MLFQNTLLALLVSTAVAFPGFDKSKSTCSAGNFQDQNEDRYRHTNHISVYQTKTKVATKTETYLSTKTLYVPVTTVTSKLKTKTKPYESTSVGAYTKVLEMIYLTITDIG
jgi:hypothetical protein